MDERDELEEASNPAGPGLNEDARSVGDLIARLITTLGSDHCFSSSGIVMFGGQHSGRTGPLRRADSEYARGGDDHAASRDSGSAPVNRTGFKPL